jgi:mono/diheme cytochrome c family protein
MASTVRRLSAGARRPLFALALLVIAAPAFAQFEANRRPPRPDVTLPDGPVRQIILSRCAACHGIDDYGYYAMDRDNWTALIERMKTTKSGLIEGTDILPEEQEVLLDWLVAEFGPDAEPFEREYVVREITDETRLSDAEAAAQLERSCSGCHSPVEPVLSAGLDEEQWRTTLTGKIATGTPILLDEVDPLIDWIQRRRSD